MNIGIVTTWYDRGAAYVSLAYMKALMQQGHQVQIYARGGHYYARKDLRWDLPNVTYGKIFKPLDKKYQAFIHFDHLYIDMLHFESWLRTKNIEAIIFNEEHGFRTVYRTKKLGYLVGAYIDYYKKETVQKFGIYDFLLCNTKRHYSIFSGHAHCLYIPWGTDLELFKPESLRKSAKSNDTVMFFHNAGFGGVNNRKGTDLLLKAFRKVQGPVKLIIHSQVPAAKYGKDVDKIIRYDSRIEFIRKTVPPPGLYHLGDVFVYPSRLEGIGLCVPEALACGLPVITTNNAPMSEFVSHGVNGLLIRVKETRQREDGYYWPEKIPCIDDLADKMQAYIDDKNLLITHKEQARSGAEISFNWMKNASRLGHYLEALVNEFGKKRTRPRLIERFVWRSEDKYVTLLTRIRNAARKALKYI